MFTIALKQQQYKTYILTDETTNSQLEVVPERGGIITRWCVQGQEILYMDTQRFADHQLSVRGGIPILFPICGNLPDNTYIHQDKQYILKQHGFARDLSWKTMGMVTEEGVKLRLSLNSNQKTKEIYPFDFNLCFTYKLQGNSLEIQQCYTNESDTESLPFSYGFHPYFVIDDKSQLEFQIPTAEYQDQKTKEDHSFNGKFDFSLDEIDVAFKHLGRKSASVIDKARKLNLTMDYDDTFSTLVFWTLKGKNFYCLEPWSAPRNALNTGENLTVLKPEADHSAFVRLTANFF